jgi:hypothetical protein
MNWVKDDQFPFVVFGMELVRIRFASVCVGYSLRRHPCCPQLGCGSGPSSNVGGWSPAAGATAEEVILPLRGGGLQRIDALQRLP